MIPFLDKIADRLIKKFPEDMGNIAVVLPSKRAVVFLKYYLSKKIEKPIFLPQFFSVEEFIEDLSGLKVIDNISLQFLLYQSYISNPPDIIDSLDEFLNWSQILLHDFNEVDRSLVDPKTIFSNLKQVKDLERWSLEDWSFSHENLTESQKSFVRFYDHIYSWYVHFNQSLSEKKCAYHGMTYRKVASQIEKIDLRWKKVWFVGLNALTKSEEAIIDCLKDRDIARVFWDADEYYYNKSNHEAGNFLRKQRKKWNEIDFKGVGDYFSNPKKKFDIIGSARNISQAKVASYVLDQLEEEELDNSKTAIILADENLLYPVLNELPDNVRDINITMGSPLKNTPLFSLVDAISYMHIQAYEYKKESFYYKDLIRVLEHPFFIKISNNENLTLIKKEIHKRNIVFIAFSWLQDKLENEDIKRLFKLWNKPECAIQSLYLLVRLLQMQLVGLKGTIESEILFVFSSCLKNLERILIDVTQDFELKTFYKILTQLVAHQVIPFTGEPLKGLQLMGILESRTIDFKNVIMLSVNEGVIPKGQTINSFIPFDLKKYFKIPTYTENDAIFSYHFHRVLQRAERITLIYNTETDDFGSGEKSRFITQLLSEYSHNPINRYLFQGNKLKSLMDTSIIIKNKGLEGSILKWAKEGVSPSALSKYNKCSLSFYYYYLANIKKQDQVDEFADSSHLGTALHNTFDKCYKKGLLNEKLIESWKPKMLDYLVKEFDVILGKDASNQGKNYLTSEIAKQLMLNFLDFERKEIVRNNKELNNVEILGLEDNLTGKISIGNVLFNLKGRVDRVDRIGDVLRIIDYKTGRVDKSEVTFFNWNEILENKKKDKLFQLLMYAYLYLNKSSEYSDAQVVAGIFSFKNLKEGLICVSRNKLNIEGKRSAQKETLFINKNVLQEFEKQLENILLKIQHEDFKQTEDLKVCQWCEYRLICNR